MQPDRNPSSDASATLRRSQEPPLTARSVIASTLLGLRPPALAPAALVRAGEIFGIAEGTIRVALSRMVAAGELEADDGTYRLAGRLLDRMERQDASRRPPRKRWDGTWRQAIVGKPSRSAAERADLRSAMRSLRFAELREGVWMRPDNLTEDGPAHAHAIVDDQCLWLSASAPDPRALAEQLWDLDGWARRAETLRDRMRTSSRALARAEVRRAVLRDGFVLAAAVLRHMQADPLMPPELLPQDWPGERLRAEYDEYARAFARRWRTWLGDGSPLRSAVAARPT